MFEFFFRTIFKLLVFHKLKKNKFKVVVFYALKNKFIYFLESVEKIFKKIYFKKIGFYNRFKKL